MAPFGTGFQFTPWILNGAPSTNSVPSLILGPAPGSGGALVIAAEPVLDVESRGLDVALFDVDSEALDSEANVACVVLRLVASGDRVAESRDAVTVSEDGVADAALVVELAVPSLVPPDASLRSGASGESASQLETSANNDVTPKRLRVDARFCMAVETNAQSSLTNHKPVGL